MADTALWASSAVRPTQTFNCSSCTSSSARFSSRGSSQSNQGFCLPSHPSCGLGAEPNLTSSSSSSHFSCDGFSDLRLSAGSSSPSSSWKGACHPYSSFKDSASRVRSGRGSSGSYLFVLGSDGDSPAGFDGFFHRGGLGRGRGESDSVRSSLVNSAPPASRDEAVQQAGASLSALLGKALKQQGPSTVKQRRAQRQVRLRVDIPLLENSPGALLALTSDVLDAFLGERKNPNPGMVAAYLPDSALASRKELGSQSEGLIAEYLSLGNREALPKDAAVVLVVAPSFADTAFFDAIVRSAGVRPVVVLNPEWSEEEMGDKSWKDFMASFSVAYSFIPLSIQGFLSKTEGAVLKSVTSGAPEGRPWLIFVKEGEKYRCVSSLKNRPKASDLEDALYSSMAANSPVNKSIKFLRGLVSK